MVCPRAPLTLTHEECACTGALARGDAKVLLMGGQDNIWDHAAGMLIAQESGFKVTNGAGGPLNNTRVQGGGGGGQGVGRSANAMHKRAASKSLMEQVCL